MERGDNLSLYVRGILERDRVSADALESLLAPQSGAESAGVRFLQPEHLDSLRKLETGQDLTDHDRAQIEAVVLPNGLRPAFDVVRDSFEQLPAAWQDLNDRRARFEPLIKGIGRVNLEGHPSLQFAGTAFVVAPDILLTNRHVAEFFIEHSAAGLQFKPGLSSALDFKQEVGIADVVPLRISAPILILDTWDAAILRVGELPPGVTPLPLAGSAPPELEGRLATVVGYPAMDPSSDLIQQIKIFRGVFDKKRLLPGRFMGMRDTLSFGRTVTALAHDCTTLGGNSGSALIDVVSMTVLGLHFKGEHLVANYSVPTWELAKEGRLSNAGIVFV